MPSTLYYIRYVKPTSNKISQIFPKALPKIKVPVRVKGLKIKNPDVKTSEARLLMYAKYMTDLFREERLEMADWKANAVRPYAERLIQLAIEYGDCHKPTMEAANYYLQEKELVHKLFKVFVPRYRDCRTAYTSIYQLPQVYGYDPKQPNVGGGYVGYYPVVLEMKGNPYPPVVPKPEIHRNSLLNVLLESAKKQYATEKKQRLQEKPASDTIDQISPSKINDTSDTKSGSIPVHS